MQDFNYLHTNCLEVSVDLGCERFPPEEDLLTSWHENHEALIKFAELVNSDSALAGIGCVELQPCISRLYIKCVCVCKWF